MVHINVLSLSVCAVTGVILALVLKSTGSSMGTFVSFKDGVEKIVKAMEK